MDMHMCRVCGGTKQLKDILLEDDEILNKLLVCANVNIHPEDMLPKLLCVQCEKNVEFSYRLRKQSEATQERLKIELQKTHVVSIPTIKPNIFNDTKHSNNIHQETQHNQIPQQIENKCKTHALKSMLQENYRFEHQNVIQCDKSDTIKIHSDGDESTSNDEAYTSSQISISRGMEDCGAALKEVFDVPVVSEYCINLITSSGSESSDCYDNFKNDKAIDTLYDENAFSCDTCHEGFNKKSEYHEHIKQHGTERYQCIQCCKFFPSRFRLKRHEETHNEISSYQCSYCNRNYRVLYNLKRHISSAHLGKKSWECSICNISFSRVDVLKRHLQLHSDERNFSCLQCSKSFKTKDYLRAHCKNHHISPSELSKTNKRTKRESINKHQCGYCGKMFKSSFSYNNHVLIHKNVKPYKCDTCNKCFRTIAALTIHQRIHDDCRPYQCDLCLKSFRQTAHLKEHKNLHFNNVSKHVCSICQTPFAKKCNLKVHMRVHIQEKPFKCADCFAEFSYMHLLQRHANKVHNRSAHKVYTLNEVDKTVANDNGVQNSGHLETEMFHYIDTLADDDDTVLDNITNIDAESENNADTSSPDLNENTKSHRLYTFDDNADLSTENESIVQSITINCSSNQNDYIEMDILDSMHLQLCDEDRFDKCNNDCKSKES